MAKKSVKFAYYDGEVIRPGRVPETDRTPEVKFTFRPPTLEISAAVNTAMMAESTPTGLADAMCSLISQSVVEWDLRKPDRANPGNLKGLPVDPRETEELQKLDEFIIDNVAAVIKAEPLKLKAKIKN